MGITSAPETMSDVLEGIDGVACHVNDILIKGANTDEHDEQVRATITRLTTSGTDIVNRQM